jgi:hypothetical protein
MTTDDMRTMYVAIEDLRKGTRQQYNDLREQNRQDMRETEARIMNGLERVLVGLRTLRSLHGRRVPT